MSMRIRVLLLLVLVGTPAVAQQAKAPPEIDPARVDAAIKAGVGYLRTKMAKQNGTNKNLPELVLLTLVHSGVKKGDPLFDQLLKTVLDAPLETTYRVALQAVALEEIDRAAYQKRLFQCAQFLVDNQCGNGQWSYGEPTTYPEPVPSPDLDIAAGDPAPGGKPPVNQRYPVRKQREGPDRGDNSNAQYAVLGLRACRDSGILLPKEGIFKAALWWRETQGAKGGWSYGPKNNPSYGSMTAGAVSALAICDDLLDFDWKKDTTIASGLAWLRDNFTVTDNPGRHGMHHYYYLYALERAGRITETPKLGKVDWYYEGARFLLENQVADGSWEKKPVDTCFAILFLRRATRPLVASVDPGPKK